jgi:hypothetical protein
MFILSSRKKGALYVGMAKDLDRRKVKGAFQLINDNLLLIIEVEGASLSPSIEGGLCKIVFSWI